MNFYYARNFKEMQNSQYHDYNVAKVLIAVWLLFITFGFICVAHALMWFQGSREHLGKLVKKIVPKTNRQKSTSCKATEEEQQLFIFNQRVIFPIMLVTVIGVTVGDIYLYAKYRHLFSNKEDPLFLFPMPVIAPVLFAVNSIMTITTFIILKHQNIFENIYEYILPTGTLFLLFGITYLLYHGFWMIVALLAYPGRILIGGIFIVPAFLVTIPIWNILITIINNWYSALKLAYNKGCKSNKKKVLKPLCIGCGWSVLLFVDIIFWSLFLVILYYISRVLLSSISLQDEKLKSALSYIAINAVSGVLLWVNICLIIHKDKDSNKET